MLGTVAIAAAGCHGSDTLTGQKARCGPTPTLLVSAASYWRADAGAGTISVVGMTVGGSDLYFSVVVDSTPPVPIRPGALMQVSTDGGAPTQLAGGYEFQTPLATPTSVIVGVLDASTYLGGILSVPRDGGAPTPLLTFDDELTTPPITDGASVYFGTGTGTIDSVPLTPGASPSSPTELAAELTVGIAVVGQRLLVLTPAGGINQIPIGPNGAGSETTLVVPLGDWVRQSLIACGADACWLTSQALEQVDPTSGVVSSADLSGGAVAYPVSLAFDGTNFFALGTTTSPNTSSSAAIERIVPGGAPVTVANIPASSYYSGGFAVDDACVYFTTSTGIYSLSSSATGVAVQ